MYLIVLMYFVADIADIDVNMTRQMSRGHMIEISIHYQRE